MFNRKKKKNDYNSEFSKCGFKSTDNDSDLEFQDKFLTGQQKQRDKRITELLNEYVSFYKSKVWHSKVCRYIILIPCMVIVIGFSALLVYLSCSIFKAGGNIGIPNAAAFITACISFISLIIGLLTIITKYFFPENDEQYIATIVETIQKNDLENKKENVRYTQNEAKSSKNDL